MIYDMFVVELRGAFLGKRKLLDSTPSYIDVLDYDIISHLWKRGGTHSFTVCGAAYKIFIRYDEKDKDQVTEWRTKHDCKKRYGY
jgi:hypothetical protein